MSWYKAGTVAVVNGNAGVTGTGTLWVTNVAAGDLFVGPDHGVYEIQSVNSNTSLTLARTYRGGSATGQVYSVAPTQDYLSALAAQVADLIATYSGIVAGTGAGKFADGSAASPGISFAADLDNGLYRPASNQLAVSLSGLQRALFTTSRMSIGGVAPAHTFHAHGSGSAALAATSTEPDGVTVRIQATADSDGRLEVSGEAPLLLRTGSHTRLRVNGGDVPDTHLSIAKTQEAWSSSYNTLDFSALGALAGSSGSVYLGRNYYNDGAWRLIADGTAVLLGMSSGGFTVYMGTTGQAGDASAPDSLFTVSPTSVSSQLPGRFGGADLGGLGFKNGSSGVASANTARDDLVLEGAGSTGFSILTPNGSTASIAAGDPENNIAGRLDYSHSAKTWTIVVEGAYAMRLGEGGSVTVAGGMGINGKAAAADIAAPAAATNEATVITLANSMRQRLKDFGLYT